MHTSKFGFFYLFNSVSLESKWCNYTVVLTQIFFYFILSYQRNQISVSSIICKIVGHALPMHMLTSFSVDKILLPRYMKLSTNLRGLLLMRWQHLKNKLGLIFFSSNIRQHLLLDERNHLNLLLSVKFGLVLWYTNHCRLFNAKSILYRQTVIFQTI